MPARIAICMGTHNPEPELFRAQVSSIRAQTHTEWACAISDDASEPDRLAAIDEAIAGDERFTVHRSEQRLGFYRNFERALEAADPDAPYIALADHDDRWYPDKLEVLLDAASREGVSLAYCDARAVDPQGNVIRETMWPPHERPNQWTDLATLLIANTVTGAASLMRRDIVRRALPFPELPGKPYHDHWVAAVALACGELAYVDRPMYDWVRHPESVVVTESAQLRPADSGRLRPIRGGWGDDERDQLTRLERMAEALEQRTADCVSPEKLREIRRVRSADSLKGAAWLAGRWLRSRRSPSSSLGRELLLLRGMGWRHGKIIDRWRRHRR